MSTLQEQIVPAYPVQGSGQIAFWCHYCQCVHRHGDCGKGMEGGARDLVNTLLMQGDCIREIDCGLSYLIMRINHGGALDRKISRRASIARKELNHLRSEVDEMACAIFPDEQSDPKRLALRVAYRDALSSSERKEIVGNAEARALGKPKQAHDALPTDGKDVPAI